MESIYDKPLIVIRDGKIGTAGYWRITVPGTVVHVAGQNFMFLSSDNTRNGFWQVLGDADGEQLTVQEFFDKFEMQPIVVVIDIDNKQTNTN